MATSDDVLEIVKQVLHLDDIDADDDFFDAGGNSLAAVHITYLIESKLGIRASLTDFFDAVDLRQFATLIEERATTAR